MRLAENGRSIVRFSEEKGTRKAKLNQTFNLQFYIQQMMVLSPDSLSLQLRVLVNCLISYSTCTHTL